MDVGAFRTLGTVPIGKGGKRSICAGRAASR